MHLSSTRSLFLAAVAVTATLATGFTPAYAAPKFGGGGGGSTSTPVGNDVSYPNCTGSLPSGQAFGIVGVNDGLANNTNPCLTAELTWAEGSKGTTSQPKSALYVNTGNPSGVSGIVYWPNTNTFSHYVDGNGAVQDENGSGGSDPVTVTVPAPYGDCSTGSDAACAYIYGYAKAYDDVNYRLPTVYPAGQTVWLDVETANSWESGSPAALKANQADLEAMAASFSSAGEHVGIYSTSYQWNQITGTPTNTTLAGLPNWIPGARTLKGAEGNCTLPAFTPGSTVTVTQYTSSYDYDYACK